MTMQRQIERLLAHRASEWHQVLEHASEAERAEFVAWLKQSPQHVSEYLEVAYTERVLQHLDADRQEDIEALLAQVAPNVVPLPVATTSLPFPKVRKPASLRWTWGVAAAAVLTLGMLLGPSLVDYARFGPEYSTSIGEQRTLQLADRSLVTMNADSRIRVRLTESHRDIRLSRGEALFSVAHDPSRPFRVRTEEAIVQAIGTQFNVYARPDGTQVSVLEGRVKIMTRDSAQAGDTAAAVGDAVSQRLDAGQAAQVAMDGTFHRKVVADVMRIVAWREHRLVFEDASLEDMVYEFNRHNRIVRLTIEGVAPDSHHYTGTFNAVDPDSFADVLAKESDLVVEKRRGEIVIRPRP